MEGKDKTYKVIYKPSDIGMSIETFNKIYENDEDDGDDF